MNERQLVTVTEFCTVIKGFSGGRNVEKHRDCRRDFRLSRVGRALVLFLERQRRDTPLQLFQLQKTYVPKEGEKVIVIGSPDYYVQGGRFSFIVSQIEPQGIGLLYQKIEELKKKLADEGIFDAAHKNPFRNFRKTLSSSQANRVRLSAIFAGR